MADQFQVDFTGDDRDLIKVIERQEKRVKALEESLKKAGQSGAKGATDITKGFDALGKKLVFATIGLQAVEKGVSLVVGSFDRWETKIRATSKAQDELAEKTLKALAAGGALADRDKIVEGLKGGVLPPEQAIEVYGAAAGAAGNEVSRDRLVEIARGAGTGAVAGYDPKVLAERAARLAAANKNTSVDDLLDIAAKLTPEQAEQLDKGAGKSLARNRKLREAQRGDYFRRSVEDALRTPEGRRTAESYRRQRDAADAADEDLREGDALQASDAAFDRLTRGRGWRGELQKTLLQWGRKGNQFLGDDVDTATSRVLEKHFGSDAVEQYMSRQADSNEAILKELQKLNNMTAVQGSRTRGVVPDNRHGEN